MERSGLQMTCLVGLVLISVPLLAVHLCAWALSTLRQHHRAWPRRLAHLHQSEVVGYLVSRKESSVDGLTRRGVELLCSTRTMLLLPL